MTQYPILWFVGDALYFSSRLLRIVAAEIDQISVARAADVDDAIAQLEESPPAAGRAMILDISLVSELLQEPGRLDALLDRVAVGLCYRKPREAQAAISQLRRLGRLTEVAFIPQSVPFDVWIATVRTLLCGSVFLPAELLEAEPAPAEAVTSGSAAAAAAGHEAEIRPRAEVLEKLTARETDVLQLVSRGMNNKLVARELGLSEHTIKLHMHHIFRKLGVSNRTGASMWYMSNGK